MDMGRFFGIQTSLDVCNQPLTNQWADQCFQCQFDLGAGALRHGFPVQYRQSMGNQIKAVANYQFGTSVREHPGA
jgi:hypothetical protein